MILTVAEMAIWAYFKTVVQVADSKKAFSPGLRMVLTDFEGVSPEHILRRSRLDDIGNLARHGSFEKVMIDG